MSLELLDKLVGGPWQPVPRDLDSSAVPTVISAQPIVEGDAVPSAARRTNLRKNVELKRYGCTRGCPGCCAPAWMLLQSRTRLHVVPVSRRPWTRMR